MLRPEYPIAPRAGTGIAQRRLSHVEATVFLVFLPPLLHAGGFASRRSSCGDCASSAGGATAPTPRRPSTDGDGRPPREVRARRHGELRRDLIASERAALLDMRDRGELRVDVLRDIQRDLDLEEARLR
jgi:hypothetical protein